MSKRRNFNNILTIGSLNKLVLKKVFEGLTYDEDIMLEMGIEEQTRKRGLKRHEKKELEHIIACLIKNEQKGFDKLKENLIRHKLDYRLVMRDGI